MTELIGKHTRVLGDDRAELAADLKQRYIDGASIRSLSVELQRSYGFIHRVLIESGVKLRPRGGARGPRK